jgi:hypothetical protein
MTAAGAVWRWVSSERQLADGLTKEQARRNIALVLRNGTLKLIHDPSYTAAKKKKTTTYDEKTTTNDGQS